MSISAKNSKRLRLCITLGAVIILLILALKGIYGSFSFTFSIPLLWQAGLLGKPVKPLGFRLNYRHSVIAAGISTGLIAGFIGGNLLKYLGIAGYRFEGLQIHFLPRFYNLHFPIQNELGYRLLVSSSSLPDLFLYLIFSIFLVGLGEEFLWRGFIGRKLSGYLSKNLAIWVTAAIFALFHTYIFAVVPVSKGIFFLALIALAGALWGYLFEFFNNLWAAALSHGISAFIIWKYYFFALHK